MKSNLAKIWGNKLKDYKTYTFDNKIYQENTFYNWLKHIPKKGKALDQGCGTGFYTIMLDRMGYKVTGLDFSEILLREAQKNRDRFKGHFKLVKGDIRNMPFKDKSFDIIISGGIVEHVKETDKALDELQRTLKTGGILLINVPQRVGIFTIAKLLQQSLGLWTIGYEKSFTIQRFKKLLVKRGFEIKAFYLEDIGIGKRPFIGKILRLLDLPFRIIGLGGQHMFFLCIKK